MNGVFCFTGKKAMSKIVPQSVVFGLPYNLDYMEATSNRPRLIRHVSLPNQLDEIEKVGH